MATYYVDPTATGNDDGSSQANAWTTLQRAIDGTGGTQPAAGDIVYCRAGGSDDETLSAQIDVDGNQGTITTGLIKFIGVNSSWVNDGTQYVINGNSAVGHCIDFNLTTAYYHLWENFVFKNATADAIAVDTSYGNNVHLFNCAGINSARGGTFRQNTSGSIIRCRFSGNTGVGIYRGTDDCLVAFCCIRDNGGDGINGQYGNVSLLIGNLIFDNGGWGVDIVAADASSIINNAIDNNASGGVKKATGGVVKLIGNRITNHSGSGDIGFDCASEVGFSGWNYFEDNDGANIQNATYHHEISHDGSSTNQEDQADTNEGYASLTEGSEDYNLDSDATGFEQAITIPTGQ